MTEQTIYSVLYDFLAALLNTGVAVCGGIGGESLWRAAPNLPASRRSRGWPRLGLIEYEARFP